MGATKSAAQQAAAWVVNMESGPERTRLWNGHMTRRREAWQDAHGATDHTEADAWLVEQWASATKGNQ